MYYFVSDKVFKLLINRSVQPSITGLCDWS